MVEESYFVIEDSHDEHERAVPFSLCEFLRYMPFCLSWQSPQSSISLWVFWNQNKDIYLRTRIENALQLLEIPWIHGLQGHVLLQFWTPVNIDGKCFLTTSDEPFGFTALDKGLCWYRKKCLDYKFLVDEESGEGHGLPGRVFLHKLPESIPDVQYYTRKDYPQRTTAMNCNIRGCLALPVFEPVGHFCLGVLELVATAVFNGPEIFEFLYDLKVVDLHCSNHSFVRVSHIQPQEIDEVKQVLEVVCRSHDLPYAQTWIPCKYPNFVASKGSSHDKFDAIYGEDVILITDGPWYASYDQADSLLNFGMACDSHPFRNGRGVVGRAFASRTACFCDDVSGFSTSEYPLARYAHLLGLTSCFAISVRSANAGNDVYILEFYCRKDDKREQKLLDLILMTMKKHSRSFKVASGEEIGEELPVEVIKFSVSQKSDSLDRTQTTSKPSSPGNAGIGGEPVQQHLSVKSDLVPNDSNLLNMEISQKSLALSKNKLSTLIPDTEDRKANFLITYEDLKQKFGLKLKDAAEDLGVSRSTLKRICRQYDIPRWPSHKRVKVDHSIREPCKGHLTSSNTTPKQDIVPLVSGKQEANITVKATYKKDIIKFHLTSSSRLTDLLEEVTRRLELEIGRFMIKYLDEDSDLILITCDTDLGNCIAAARSLDKAAIALSIQPISS